MSRVFTFAALAALFFVVSAPSGLADYGAVSRYADRGIAIAVSYDFESGQYAIVTKFARSFTGTSHYTIYFGTDQRRVEFRLRLFPSGAFSWARRQGRSGWVAFDGSIDTSPPSPDRKTLDIGIPKSEIGSATAFDLSVADGARMSPTWRYPAAPGVLHDQAAAGRAVLRLSDLGQPGWQFLPQQPGTRCVSGQPTAIGRKEFNEVATLSTSMSSDAFIYATSSQARRAFSNMHSSLVRCYAGFIISNDSLVTGLPTGALAATYQQGSSTLRVRLGYALAGRGVVLFTQSTLTPDLPFATAQEAALVRLMASRLS